MLVGEPFILAEVVESLVGLEHPWVVIVGDWEVVFLVEAFSLVFSELGAGLLELHVLVHVLSGTRISLLDRADVILGDDVGVGSSKHGVHRS